MNYIKYLKYIMSAALMLCLMPGLTSCEDDIVLRGEDGNDYDTVSLKIQLPGPTVVNPMSRAEAADFDKVNNLNILVCSGDAVKKCIYLDGTRLPQTEVTTGTETDGITITSKKDKYGYMEYTIDFALNFWAGLGATPGDCDFYAVANYDSEIAEKSLDAVRQLQATEILSNGHSFVPTENVMYGEGVKGDPTTDPNNPSIKIRTVTIGLKRTVAMITLQIDGTQLNPNVVISIDSVALRNVPKSCYLGAKNTPTDHATKISKNGDFKGGNVFSGGYRLIGTAKASQAGYSVTDGYQTRIGGHYSANGDGTVSDVTNTYVHPMFMFENRQPDGVCGGGSQGAAQVHKRPNDGIAATEAAIANYNLTGVCSYIEVMGQYTEYKTETSADVAQKGTAVWRFFLGRNPDTNFDVERNSNYRITLNLAGSGIGEANYSWRVDTQLETPQVVGNPNMVVGGGGEMFCVELANDLQTDLTNGLKISGADATFVYVYTRAKNQLEWVPVSGIPGNTHWDGAYPNPKQIWFYVQPLMPDDKTYCTDNERTCTVYFRTNNGTEVTHVTFTQYRPVLFSVTQADLNNHSDDQDLKRAYSLMQKYYNVDVEQNGEFKFWADRIDRDPMPWGFSGVRMDKNQNTGFENVYHLIKPKTENISESCPTHIAYAGHYLPTGKGYRKEIANTNPIEYETYIDYSNGSCMMHAAMQNYFQGYYPYPEPSVKPTDLINVTVDQVYRPGDENDPHKHDRQYSWCIPSIVGCQIVELLDRYYDRIGDNTRGFDPKYPIKKWVSYWTSNAATLDLKETYPSLDITGLRRSFVYQFGMDLEQITEGQTYPGYLVLPRTTPTKYRLLNIRPADAN